MALHRDIYWVGRQWAVTGYGMQACDQKQKSQFDIEAHRLWDDDVLERLRANKWLNVEDFDKALAIARQAFSGAIRKPTRPSLRRLATRRLRRSALSAKPPSQNRRASKLDPFKPRRLPRCERRAITKPDPEPPSRRRQRFHMLFSGAARFIRPGACGCRNDRKLRVCFDGDSRIRRRSNRTRRHFDGCEFSAPMTTASTRRA